MVQDCKFSALSNLQILVTIVRIKIVIVPHANSKNKIFKTKLSGRKQ